MVTAMPTGSYVPLAMRREAEKDGVAKITLVREFLVSFNYRCQVLILLQVRRTVGPTIDCD